MDERAPLFSYRNLEMYKVRPADIWLAQLWKSLDTYHQGTPADYWLEQDWGVESYLMRERDDWLFFFQLRRMTVTLHGDPEGLPHQACEIHMLFAPVAGQPRRELDRHAWSHRDLKAARSLAPTRIMRGMEIGCEWLEMALRPRGIELLFFATENPRLILFTQKRLGFALDGEKVLKWLVPYQVAKNEFGNVA